jgi:hypothetical protein
VDRKEIDLQKTIVQKLHKQGEQALTDDEVQYIRYKEIMVETNKIDCDMNIFESDSCENCRDRDACFVKIVKDLLKQ